MELIANFVTSVSIGNAPLDVEFTNTSSGPYVRVEWDFGDGNKSVEVNPSHTYTVDGSYTVSLTVFSSDGNSTTTTRTITVLKEQVTENANSDIQQTLLVSKRFSPGQVSIKKYVTTGSTFSTSYPLIETANGYEVNLSGDFCVSGHIKNSSLNGNQVFTPANSNLANIVSFVSNATGNGGVWAAVVLTSSGDSTPYKWEDVFPGTGQSQTLPRVPVLFYNITSNASSTFFVDRPTIDMYDISAIASCTTYFFGNSGNNYTFGSSMNSPYTSTRMKWGLDGMGKFFTDGAETEYVNRTRGLGTFLGFTGSSGVPFAVVYTQDSGNTADRWYPGSVEFNIPWIMWHENENACGLIAYDTVDSTQIDESTNLRFRYLRAGTTDQDTIIGKVFYDKKMLVITDPELAITMSMKTDRSWSLPKPSLTFVQDPNGWLSGGTASPTGVSWYFTYAFVEYGYDSVSTFKFEPAQFGAATNSFWGMNHDVTNVVPCGYVQRVNVPSGSTGFGYFVFTIPKLNFGTGGTNCLNSGNLGFTPGWLWVYAATGLTSESGPDPSSWRIMSGSPSHSSESIWTASSKFTDSTSITIDSSSEFRYDLSGYSWSWTSSPVAGAASNISGATTLGAGSSPELGDQPIIAASIKGNYASHAYKMSAVCVARNNEFNKTQNKTFDGGVNNSVFISEVGLYNEGNDLLMVGKLSRPIEKNEQKFLTVKLELDL